MVVEGDGRLHPATREFSCVSDSCERCFEQELGGVLMELRQVAFARGGLHHGHVRVVSRTDWWYTSLDVAAVRDLSARGGVEWPFDFVEPLSDHIPVVASLSTRVGIRVRCGATALVGQAGLAGGCLRASSSYQGSHGRGCSACQACGVGLACWRQVGPPAEASVRAAPSASAVFAPSMRRACASPGRARAGRR